MKFAVVTFGCRVNQADSLRLEEEFLSRGGTEVPARDADLVIVNTCSVTSTADQGARQTIRRIARENPRARIVVTGCYATRRPEEIAALPGVERIAPNDFKPHIIPLLQDPELTTALRFAGGDGSCGSPVQPGLTGRTAFTLGVQTGCDERCSYCIIPRTRGSGRSVSVADVVREVARIAAAGFKEVVLTGVHLGSYGRDLEPPTSLLQLLRALHEIDSDVTFRVSSLEPMDCRPEIVEVIASSGGRFAPHFHLPLQHASDRILGLMRRPYTADVYRRLVEGIVRRLPHASIGSDIIVGFPGETDHDFDQNLEYLSRAPLSHLHVFPYSDRPGTEATLMGPKVPGPHIRERGAQIRQIGETLAYRFRQSQEGTVRPALTIEDGTLAVTDNFLKVRIPQGYARNTRVAVRIDAVSPTLRGSVMD